MRLIRTVRFRALHRYGRAGWSDSENRAAFGETADPHGHDFTVRVCLEGEFRPDDGFLVDLGVLDGHLEALTAPLRGAELNEVIPAFRDGGRLPSTENLALWFYQELASRTDGDIVVRSVRVAESDTLASEVFA